LRSVVVVAKWLRFAVVETGLITFGVGGQKC
jgi:hypothetical protein